MNKVEQRLLVSELLRNISSDELEVKSKKISSILDKFLIELKTPNKLIGVYAPMSKEVKWFLTAALENFDYCLPQMESNFKMKYYCSSFEEVKTLNYKESFKGTRTEVVPSIVIVPGVAFDKEGNRLGRGKGYFDRYLKDKDILKVGICFEEQLIDKVVTSEHDIKMNYIITENTVFKGIK